MADPTSARTHMEHLKIITMLQEGSPDCEKFTMGHLWKKRNSFAGS